RIMRACGFKRTPILQPRRPQEVYRKGALLLWIPEGDAPRERVKVLRQCRRALKVRSLDTGRKKMLYAGTGKILRYF
ncbi:hypothetical protein LCGC14_2898540, partial [marine sediment metagenome]